MPYIKAHIVVQEDKERLTIREGGFYMSPENVYNIHKYDYHPVLGKNAERTCVELTPHKNGEKRFVIFNAPLDKTEDMLLNSHRAVRQSRHPKIKYRYNDLNNIVDMRLVTLSQQQFDTSHKDYRKQREEEAARRRQREQKRREQLLKDIRRIYGR